MQFYQLAIGARFEFFGREFTKMGMNMAKSQLGIAIAFHGACDVKAVGEPLLLPEGEAEKWKPVDLDRWAVHLEPSQ